MTVIEYLSAQPLFFIAIITILGATVGSFLNVVIYRLPLILERQWQEQCAELQHPDGKLTPAVSEPFNLAVPRSRCPQCGHQIRAIENIPIISYLLLRGRCAKCKVHISIRYPIIEAVTAVLSGFVAWHFGVGWEAACALVLTWSLIPLTMIDFDHQLLPDVITLPFLWVGLAASLFSVFTYPGAAIIGALAGYLSLWSIYWAFKLLTGKEGMGYGDFKLLAMLGAWLGWQALPVVILLSAFVGAVVGISLILFLGRDRQLPIPYGPYLAAAGWITMIWGNDLTRLYLKMAGLNS
ncbi:MAG: prepilin peptidase [Gammaproteobacteria bacterium]|nr:prepilin peptidase [Gammaproteobacteria bacterium]